MTKIKILLALIISLTFFSCSKDEDSISEQKSSPTDQKELIEFQELKASKNISFLNEPIIIDIEGTGFNDVKVSSDNPDLVIKKVSLTTYSITASKPLTSTLSIQLLNGESIKTKSISLNFEEHGVFTTSSKMEGVAVNSDKTKKLIELLGEPELKLDNPNDTNFQSWYYFSKGIYFYINKNSSIVRAAYAYAYKGWKITSNDKKEFTGTAYPYKIDSKFELTQQQTKMGAVVKEYGEDFQRMTLQEPIEDQFGSYNFNFSKKRISFSFTAKSIDDFENTSVYFFGIF